MILASGKATASLVSKIPDKIVRWGIVSAGKISADFVKAMSVTDGAEAAAVAARSLTSSRAFAKSHDIPKSYGSYDELFHDPDIDVVYIGSVADNHASLAKRALTAGKPTVVEKPFALNFSDASSIRNLARERNLFCMEGMWTRCFPCMRKVRDVIEGGEIGEIISIQGDFGWSTSECPPEHRIWSSESGGMILDVGMYMAQLGQVGFPCSDIERVQSMGDIKNGVDHTVMANIMYGKRNGGGKGFLQFYVTGEANTEERVTIQGTKGRILIEPPAHTPTRVRVFYDKGRGESKEVTYDFPLPDDSFTTWNYPNSIGFTYQINQVNSALRRGEKECPHFTLDESTQVAFILDEIMAQVKGDNNTNMASVSDEQSFGQT